MIKFQKIVLVLLGLSCFLFFVVYKTSKKAKQDNSVLVVGTSADYPPYESKDKQGNIVGFDIDVVGEVACRLGKTVVMKDMPFTSLIFGLLSGDIDVIASGMSPTPRRAKFVSFTKKYVSGDAFVMLTLKNRFKPESVADLYGKRVVVNTGYTAENYMSQQKGIHLIRLKTPADALVALNSGSVDAFVCARSTALAMMAKLHTKNQLVLAELAGTGDDCAFALRKDATELTQLINNALDAMHDDGTLNCLKEKWNL